MKLSTLRGLTLIVCLALATTSATGTDALHAVAADGRTELAVTRTGRDVRVVIAQVKAGNSFPYKDALVWGGDIDELPKTMLISIHVEDGKRVVFVPLSAYGDLGEVKSASLDPTATGFNLNLHGGDTAASYDATLSFDRGQLVSRSVKLREFPKQRWEKTTYSFPQDSN